MTRKKTKSHQPLLPFTSCNQEDRELPATTSLYRPWPRRRLRVAGHCFPWPCIHLLLFDYKLFMFEFDDEHLLIYYIFFILLICLYFIKLYFFLCAPCFYLMCTPPCASGSRTPLRLSAPYTFDNYASINIKLLSLISEKTSIWKIEVCFQSSFSILGTASILLITERSDVSGRFRWSDRVLSPIGENLGKNEGGI